MINKETFQDFISKYYLNGVNSTVKWIIEDDQIKVYSTQNNVACKVILNNFTDIKNENIAIFDTGKLLKLVNITSGDLKVDVLKTHELCTKLLVKDNNYNLEFTLADLMLVGNQSYYKTPKDKNIEIELTNFDINNLIKANKSLSEESKMFIKVTKDRDKGWLCIFTFGDSNGYNNNVSYNVSTIKGDFEELEESMPFSGDIFNSILNSNKNNKSNSILNLYSIGLLKFHFQEDNIESEYFLIRDE